MGYESNSITFKEVINKKTLNTFTLETGLHHGEPLSNICYKKINGYDLEKPGILEEELSLENRKNAWGKNYKENNIIFTNGIDGTKNKINLPGIWGGGMGIDISSLSLLEASSYLSSSGEGYFVSSHLSSIGLGNANKPDLFEDNGKGFERYGSIIEKKFYDLFEGKLGLTKNEIQQHFLKCDSNLKLDSSFQPTNKNGEIFLMKDLIALYNNIVSAKEKGLFVSINHMYKSTGYIASIKVATLAGADAITTGAGIPRDNNNNYVQPRNIVTNFLKNIGIIDTKIPTFGLIVSMTMAYAPGYDYYIDEDPCNAGGHQGAYESMLQYKKRVGKENVLKSLRAREGIDESIPIYAAGGINSASDIKEMFDMGFDGVQLGTNFAVSKEAINLKGEDFKEALISGNHYGEETEIDEIAKKAAEKLRTNIENEVEKFRLKFKNNLLIDFENNVLFDNNFLGIIDFNYQNIINVINFIEYEIFSLNSLDSKLLNKNEKFIYNIFSENIYKIYNGNIEDFRKDLKEYGNLLKGIREFERLADLGKIPTHLLFDSVVGFIGRLRIEGGEHRLLNGTIMKSIKCIQCVTHCILRNAGGISDNKGSKFCISDSLRIGDRDSEKSLILNFSGKTTCFYPKIRPVIDNILAYTGVEVIRD